MEEGKEKMSTLKKTENNLGQDEKVRSLWKQSVIQFKHNRLAVVGLVIIVLFIVTILTTLAVDQITNYSFYNEYILKQDLSLRLAKPSLAHPFGCDEFGRDLLLRILWGTKLSFAIGVVAIALSVIMGAPFGMIAAFYGGKTDNAIMRVMDVLLAVPKSGSTAGWQIQGCGVPIGRTSLPCSGPGKMRLPYWYPTWLPMNGATCWWTREWPWDGTGTGTRTTWTGTAGIMYQAFWDR